MARARRGPLRARSSKVKLKCAFRQCRSNRDVRAAVVLKRGMGGGQSRSETVAWDGQGEVGVCIVHLLV